MSKKAISVQFRCGHVEKLTQAEIKKQGVRCDIAFIINNVVRADAGDQYCLACSTKGKAR